MAGKVTNIGERKLLLGGVNGLGVLTLKLAKLTFTPLDDMLPTDFTEANYVDYVAQVLNFTGLEAGNPGGKAVAHYDLLTFTCGGDTTPNDIFGYWVQDAANDVLFVERFNGNPRRMRVNGDLVFVDFSIREWSPL